MTAATAGSSGTTNSGKKDFDVVVWGATGAPPAPPLSCHHPHLEESIPSMEPAIRWLASAWGLSFCILTAVPERGDASCPYQSTATSAVPSEAFHR